MDNGRKFVERENHLGSAQQKHTKVTERALEVNGELRAGVSQGWLP